MALITYIDKDESQVAPDPRKIVTDDDMNEIKNVVNTNAGAAFISTLFRFNEIPTGTVNGSNTAFTLANTPRSGTLMLYTDGVRMVPTVDYTITGANITMGIAPVSTIIADYMI